MVVVQRVELPGRIEVTITIGKGVNELTFIDGQVYIRSNSQYLRAAGASPAVTREQENRWLHPPPLPGDAAFAALTKPADIGYCLLAQDPLLGQLSFGGRTIIQGAPAIVLDFHGDVPGGAPGRLYLAASGPPLPLRFTQTATQRPGGHLGHRCGDSAGQLLPPNKTAFSAYNHPLTISVPFPWSPLDRARSGDAP
jgi:hypothetical protein